MAAECWVLTTGEAGMRTQALGLASAVGLPFEEVRLTPRPPWTWLPGHLAYGALSRLALGRSRLPEGTPRLVISCGRRSTGPAIALRRRGKGRTLAVHVQAPQCPARFFDLVVPMRHDRVRGDNLIPVGASLHGFTPSRLEAARETWRKRLGTSERPLLGVLIGGPTRHYAFGSDTTKRLRDLIGEAGRARGYAVHVTPSRRTPEGVTRALAEAFDDEDWFTLWDGTGENPYPGLLALADRLLVTGDSVSMISEALATGAPVHVLMPEGYARRHEAFVDVLEGSGQIERIGARGIDWNRPGRAPLDETGRVAETVREALARHGLWFGDGG